MPGLLGDYAKGLLGFVSDPQSWKDMGANAVGLLGAPLPTKQEAMANALRMRMRGSVMRDYPSVETDLAKSYNDKMINLALGMNPVMATVFHGTKNPGALEGLKGQLGGLKMMDGLGPHVGTAEAANERLAKNQGLSPSKAFNKPNPSLEGAYIMPFDLSPNKPFVKKSGDPYTESELQSRLAALAEQLGFDKNKTRAYSSAYGAPPQMKQAQAAVRDYLKAQGYDAIPYINSHEARGSTSYVVLDETGLKPLYSK